METVSSISTVSHVIQLAVAPVFLLSGVGAILAVLINRLSRIVDRYRMLENSSLSAKAGEETVTHVEMAILSRRARLIHWAISLCTIGALFICLVVATLFIGSMLRVGVSQLIALMFVGAMLALIAGLLSFLREITLATGSIHVRKP
jgi:shikimate kinase